MSHDAWVLDAWVVADDQQRLGVVVGPYRSIPKSWAVVVAAPMTLDGLGNFGPAGGRLPDRSGISRLILAHDDGGLELVTPATPDTVHVVEALVSATQAPLATPHLLASIAQLLALVGVRNYRVHPAVAGVASTAHPSGESLDALWRSPFLDAIFDQDSTLVLKVTETLPSIVRLSALEERIWALADGRPIEKLQHAAHAYLDSANALHCAVHSLEEKTLLSPQPSWRRHPASAWVDGGSYATVVSSQDPRGVPLSLVGSAYSVWAIFCSEQAISTKDLVSLVAEAYGVTAKDVSGDVEKLLYELYDRAVIAHV